MTHNMLRMETDSELRAFFFSLFRVAAFCATLLSALSCSETIVDPPPPPAPSFSVHIAVADTAGAPVPGIRISCWNKLARLSGELPAADSAPPPTLASSSVRLLMPAKGKVWMALYEMDANLLLALYSDNTLWGPGVLRSDFVTGSRTPPFVLKCLCIVEDSLSHVVYRDSVYTLCWQPYPERSILGYASPAGTFTTGDSLMFPHVLGLPPLVHTGAGAADTLGLFSLSDTLVFALTDTATMRQQFFERVVERGKHDTLSFVWNPALVARESPSAPKETGLAVRQEYLRVRTAGLGWKLEQNFPNPYGR